MTFGSPFINRAFTCVPFGTPCSDLSVKLIWETCEALSSRVAFWAAPHGELRGAKDELLIVDLVTAGLEEPLIVRAVVIHAVEKTHRKVTGDEKKLSNSVEKVIDFGAP